jgi:hypothetical protein
MNQLKVTYIYPLTYFLDDQNQARYRLLMRFLLPELSLTQ